MGSHEFWSRYKNYLVAVQDVGIRLDISRMSFPDTFLTHMEQPMQAAFRAMEDLEKGAIANPDEHRMVGHYWLRAPHLAPSEEIRHAIESTLSKLERFAADVHAGRVAPEGGSAFSDLLVIGIGGSALGPQLVADALGTDHDAMGPHFIDNTDPDGIDRVLSSLKPRLDRTLVTVISKSGSTPETRNGMLEAREVFRQAGLSFNRHAVAVTGEGSKLFQLAKSEGWIDIFPMWDWVGGRTSVTSAVGLLPAALQGIDVRLFLEGAKKMDERTRSPHLAENPAALLAAMWYYAGEGHGAKDMVIIPYKDRLVLFSRYLQQLIMESLGKELDLQGRPVQQGIAVYGNKGSTDQHAYVQQLREGIPNFFVTFIQVLKGRETSSLELEPGISAEDYLMGFLMGTRKALHDNGRESITLTLERVDPSSLGAFIALYERTVGLYASLIGINAYHQPGVEAGKKAASAILETQKKLVRALRSGNKGSADTLAEVAGIDDVETVYHILEHLAANGRIEVDKGSGPFDHHYRL